MQSKDAIEVVAPLGGGISEVALFPDAAAVLAGTAGVLVRPGRIFHAAGRHLSSLESDVALFVRRIEIPVIGRDGEIAGVLCRNSPLSSASRSTPLTQDQHTAIMGEATKTILHDITNILATIDCGLSLLERQTDVEGRSSTECGTRYSAVQFRFANSWVEIGFNKMDTRTLRPGGTLSQQRSICGTPSVLVGHFTPRLPKISPILPRIQKTFTSRSSICAAMRAQRCNMVARS